MHFVFLYGRPATGKLTVAKELATATGFRLFHNHLIVDATLAVYDFGTAGFIALRDELWRTAFARIARDTGIEGVIFTFNPENSVPQAFVDDLFVLFEQAGATIHCVELTCEEDEIERRLASGSRQTFGKLTDVDLYRDLRAKDVFAQPVIRRDRLVIDTGRVSAAEAAAQIAGQCKTA